jgi:hypothetical protein
MSFGFSVGDFIAGANLALRVYQSLSDAAGSSSEYQKVSKELFVVHRVLVQVEQLRARNQLAQSTLNALLFLTNGLNEAMESFMQRLSQYTESLQAGGSGNILKDAFRKGKWSLHMPGEVRSLSLR